MTKSQVSVSVAFELTRSQMEFIKSKFPKYYSLELTSKIKPKPEPSKEPPAALDSLEEVLKRFNDFGAEDFIKLEFLGDTNRVSSSPKVKIGETEINHLRPCKEDIKEPEEPHLEPMVEEHLPDPQPPAAQSDRDKYLLILSQIRQHSYTGLFENPLPLAELETLGQQLVERKQMTLQIIENNIKADLYSQVDELHRDLLLIWLVSYSFAQVEPVASLMEPQIQPPPAPCYSSYNNQQSAIPSKEQITMELPIAKLEERLVSKAERFKLCQQIRCLETQYLTGVWDIVTQGIDTIDIVFDLEVLEDDKVLKLQMYVERVFEEYTWENSKEKL